MVSGGVGAGADVSVVMMDCVGVVLWCWRRAVCVGVIVGLFCGVGVGSGVSP